MADPTVERSPTNEKPVQVRLYRKRFLILGLFILLSASNALQWIEYSIISNIVTAYYGVGSAAVDFTSMVYMLCYAVLVFPGSWFLDKYGLRMSIVIGAFGNCLGAWLKMLSVSPDRFWLTLSAQTIAGASQVFILGIPSHLAATWFGAHEVSTACAAGVFGNQLGIAMGFILPPWLVRPGAPQQVGHDLLLLFLASALLNSLVFLLALLFFPDKPAQPPSVAQARNNLPPTNYLREVGQLFRNASFCILLLTYALNVGVFYAVSTLLNQMVLQFHPGAQTEAGTIGLLMVVAGMAGSVVCGYLLDRFHHYKLTTLVVYLLSVLGMLGFSFSLRLHLYAVFAAAAALGFFMTGYLPVGFEFGAELTYPASEGTTAGLLNLFAQIAGMAMTVGMGRVMHTWGTLCCNLMLSAFLLLGMALTVFIKSDLRRHKHHLDQLEGSSFENGTFSSVESASTSTLN